MKEKININLFNFISNGEFGKIKLGMVKDEILYIYQEQDDYMCLKNETLLTSPIWKYDDFELHFNNDELVMIYNDYLNHPYFSKKIIINPWIFEPKKLPDLENCIIKLLENQIIFKIDFDKDRIILTIMKSKIKLYFHFEENERNYNKIIISVMSKEK